MTTVTSRPSSTRRSSGNQEPTSRPHRFPLLFLYFGILPLKPYHIYRPQRRTLFVFPFFPSPILDTGLSPFPFPPSLPIPLTLLEFVRSQRTAMPHDVFYPLPISHSTTVLTA